MRVLILSPYGDLIEDIVRASGCEPIIRPGDLEVSDWPECDWVVSFGYRKIIQKRMIEQFKGKIINIHCSLLPWNRGADPNFWSWFDDTPRGVTIHRIDEGIDTGEILNQEVVFDSRFRGAMTLRTTYEDLQVTAVGLFSRTWPFLINKNWEPKQIAAYKEIGTYHRTGDTDKYWRYLPLNWESPVSEVKNLGSLFRGSK